jgi:hypothetical protein
MIRGLSPIQAPNWGKLFSIAPETGAILTGPCDLAVVVRHARSRCVYLATPYSREVINDDLCWDVGLSMAVETRTARWARRMAIEGVTAVSPILQACAMCHADMEGHLDPLDDAFWSAWCQPLLRACGAVVVPPMPGWKASRGVWREVIWAIENNVPVYLLRDDSEGVA